MLLQVISSGHLQLMLNPYRLIGGGLTQYNYTWNCEDVHFIEHMHGRKWTPFIWSDYSTLHACVTQTATNALLPMK